MQSPLLTTLVCDMNEKQTFTRLIFGGALPAELPHPPWMRLSLPRHDLLGEERLTSLSEEKGLEPLSQWAFIEFSLHRNTGRALSLIHI